MWHWDLNDYKAALFVRQLTLSLEEKGIKVYPNINTGWHYDDKVGQKYLLEAIKAPLVQSYVFYSKQDAINWLKETSFPKVFKLRSGAASSNVKLVKNKRKAKHLVNKAFGCGFPRFNRIGRLKERIYMLRRDKDLNTVKTLFTGLARLFITSELEKYSPREKGYIYFQDFLPNNVFDTRIVIIGDRCFNVRRYCRKKDFRASGSGIIAFGKELVDKKMVEIAFDVADKLGTQSLAFDFIYENGNLKIIELSYCFPMGKNSMDGSTGYWDRNLNWHEIEDSLQKFIIEDFVKSLSS